MTEELRKQLIERLMSMSEAWIPEELAFDFVSDMEWTIAQAGYEIVPKWKVVTLPGGTEVKVMPAAEVRRSWSSSRSEAESK